MTAEFWVTQTFNGLSYGALLFLLASGLSSAAVGTYSGQVGMEGFVDIRLPDAGGRKQLHEANDATLDQMNARRFERLEEKRLRCQAMQRFGRA